MFMLMGSSEYGKKKGEKTDPSEESAKEGRPHRSYPRRGAAKGSLHGRVIEVDLNGQGKLKTHE